MDDRVQVRVIVVMDVRSDAVQKGSMLGISKKGTLVAEDRCRGRPKKGTQGFLLRFLVSQGLARRRL